MGEQNMPPTVCPMRYSDTNAKYASVLLIPYSALAEFAAAVPEELMPVMYSSSHEMMITA
jgi:hypothetical protein